MASMSDDEGSDVDLYVSEPFSCSRSPPSVAGPIAPVEPVVPVPDLVQDVIAGTRKRKSPAAAAPKTQKPPKEFGTNQAYVYYGLKGQEFDYMDGDDLRHCKHVIGELLQPQSMSLVDLQCWIIKLLRLHPETQDLGIKGFFSARCPLLPNPERRNLEWKTHYLYSDENWASYVMKVKRRYGMEMFVLSVDCSELKHYRSLFKAGYHAYSQVAMGADPQCTLTQVLPDQKSLSDRRPALYVSECLKENPAMTTTEIVENLANGRHNVWISHAGAWRVKQKALELQFGTFYDAYNYVPRLLKDIKYISHRNYVDIKDIEVAGCDDFRVLHRIFWSFAQCIQSFLSCRPVLCIKGIPLHGKYQGVPLTALALDANDNYLPVAFAVIEGESKESWLWFLKNVKEAIVKERRDVCIIHDYKRELLDAIGDLQNNCNRQEPLPWRDVQSRCCMEHLSENFLGHFGNKDLMLLFKRLCQQNQQSKFVKIWKELDDLTIKYMSEKEGCAARYAQQDSAENGETNLEAQRPYTQPVSVENGEEGNDPDGSHIKGNESGDKNGKVARSFSEWIGPKSIEKWSLLHDTKGARYGVMGTNVADNHILKGIECLPLTAMVEVTFRRMAEYFKNQSAEAKKAIGNPSMNYAECVQRDMNAKAQKAEMHQVIPMNTNDDSDSFFGDEDNKFKVQLKQKHVTVHLKSIYTGSMSNADGHKRKKVAECSCNKPMLHHKPCSHVIAVCCHIGVNAAAYISPYYSLSFLEITWSGTFDVSNKALKCFQDCRLLMPFETPTWIPDKKLECCLPAFLTSGSIQTVMDEEDQVCSTERPVADNQEDTVEGDEIPLSNDHRATATMETVVPSWIPRGTRAADKLAGGSGTEAGEDLPKIFVIDEEDIIRLEVRGA